MSQHSPILQIHGKHRANIEMPIHGLLEYEVWWDPSYRLGNGEEEERQLGNVGQILMLTAWSYSLGRLREQ